MSYHPDLEHAARMLERAERINLFSHIRPDGDAYGTMLGLGLSLEATGKTVRFFNEDGMTPTYRFLPHSDRIERTPSHAVEGLNVVVDTSAGDRAGATFSSWAKVPDINLDHHVSNTRYGTVNVVAAELPAAAVLIQELIESQGWPMTADIASCLYVGLTTDTGSFKYRGTTAATLHAAARLVEAGADPSALAKKCFQSITAQRFELHRLAMQTLVLECDHQFAHIRFTPEMFATSGASREDTEGLVERLQEIQTVQVSAVFELVSPDSLRVSLRSREVIDVGSIAASFGGGGHRLAAGIRLSGPVESNINSVLARIRETLAPSS